MCCLRRLAEAFQALRMLPKQLDVLRASDEESRQVSHMEPTQTICKRGDMQGKAEQGWAFLRAATRYVDCKLAMHHKLVQKLQPS